MPIGFVWVVVDLHRLLHNQLKVKEGRHRLASLLFLG